jgi:uncharacterized protein (TIGR02118 family)
MAKRGDKLPAEFRQEWLERHRELKRAAKKVVAAIVTTDMKDPPYDGMSALYYGSATEARAALDDDPAKFEVACEETTIAQKADADRLIKPNGQLKIVRTMIRRKDLTLAKFKDYWLKTRSNLDKRLIADSPALRVVATFALPPEAGGNEPQFDGMLEIYFASIDDIRTVFSGPLAEAMRKDDENFVQMDAPAIRLVVEEILL